ncbi:hypothetical protein GCM10009554_58240 [Kribbella koreensis]|uniref:Uncharacterized protein n=2 Tax=Kribbella TaxID=182639 RepID=A0ABP6X0X1_9ACTN
MIDDLETLLKQASNPADMAVVLLAGTAGFVAEAGLSLVGFMSPGVVGITAATGALGVKRSIDAWQLRRRRIRAEHLYSQDIMRRIDTIRLMLRAAYVPAEVESRLDREVELYTAGVTSIEDLHEAVQQTVEYLRRGEAPREPVPLSGPARLRRRRLREPD